MRKYNALTLIELLIASSIFVVIMATIYSAFYSGLFGYRNIEDNIDVYQAARSILRQIDLDIRNSFAFSKEEAKFTGGENGITFLTLVDTFSEENITQDYALVSYKLEGDKLMRLCRRNKEALNENSQVQPEEMASGIAIKFEYGHTPFVTADIEFKESWAGPSDLPGEQKRLPAAVKVTLNIKGKTRQDFQRTVYLPLAELAE